MPSFFFLLVATLLTHLSFLSLVHTDSAFPQQKPTSGWVSQGNYEVGSSVLAQRYLLEGANGGADGKNSSFVLAAKRTYRKDPLNGFKKYTGGWNISEKHYWASVGFTAAPLFVIAAIWFVVFGLFFSLSCLCYFCCVRQSYGYSRVAYALSLGLLILFTVAAIIGCIVLYTGQGRFHKSTTNTLAYIEDQADTTVDNLRNVSNYLAAAKQIGVNKNFLPSNVQTDIDEIESKINSSASLLSNKTAENVDNMRDVLDDVSLTLIIVAAVMLFLTFLGFLFSILGMQSLVYFLVIFGWILVTGTFILCGTFALLHNVSADTCVAMDQWVQNPTAHTALDDILPCVDNATAQETLMKSKEVSSQLVNLVNQIIANVSNINVPPTMVPFYYNQSGPLVPLICNPFDSNLADRNCTFSEVRLKNGAQVLKNYVCEVSSDGICVTTGRITPTFYTQMAAALNVSYGLYHHGPFLVSLEDCTFVRETFSSIYTDHCPGLRLYSKWISIGLMMVAAAVMLSLVLWIVYGRERRHRAYTKQQMSRSPFEGYEGYK